MKLPFLKNESKWPKIREDEDRVANPSYDTQIEDSLVDEILVALEAKDSSALRSAVLALVEHIRSTDEL